MPKYMKKCWSKQKTLRGIMIRYDELRKERIFKS